MTTYTGNIEGDLVLKAGDDATGVTSVGGGLDISAEGIQLPDAATARARLIEVAKHALSTPQALEMGGWHNESRGCGTSHCVSGWAVHLEGEAGYALEKEVSQLAAGNILLGWEASALFYLDNDTARSKLHALLVEAGEQPYPASVEAGA